MGMFFAIVCGIIYLDQMTKWLAIICLEGKKSFVVLKNVLQFTYVTNKGAAFGILSEHRWVFLLLSTLALAAIIVYMVRWRPKSQLACIAIAFIAGGGLGNMVDRIFLGYVVDFIDFIAFPKVWSYIFNVADSFVCVGAGLLMLHLILSIVKEAKKEKLAVASSTSSGAEPSCLPVTDESKGEGEYEDEGKGKNEVESESESEDEKDATADSEKTGETKNHDNPSADDKHDRS